MFPNRPQLASGASRFCTIRACPAHGERVAILAWGHGGLWCDIPTCHQSQRLWEQHHPGVESAHQTSGSRCGHNVLKPQPGARGPHRGTSCLFSAYRVDTPRHHLPTPSSRFFPASQPPRHPLQGCLPGWDKQVTSSRGFSALVYQVLEEHQHRDLGAPPG